ncbi:MAG: hypothetical protein AABY32_02280 [Nanoarchaeota archaeon]
MKKLFFHKFNKKLYEIKLSNRTDSSDGSCDDPSTKKKTIVIKEKLNPKRKLEVFIHEALHALFWNLEEETVTNSAEDIGKFLWKLGYRKIEDE